jgi:hypothetical protein
MPTLVINITSYYRQIAVTFFIFMMKIAHIAPQGVIEAGDYYGCNRMSLRKMSTLRV